MTMITSIITKAGYHIGSVPPTPGLWGYIVRDT